MAQSDLLVSAISVLGDHASLLSAFVSETAEILQRNYSNYEILLIDNGLNGVDESAIHELLVRHQSLRYIRLTRPADDEIGVMVGLDAAIGDYVVVLHADFDPPGELVEMVDECRRGADLVVGVERKPSRPALPYRVLRSLYRRLLSRLVGLDTVMGTTGYRALSRQSVNALVKIRLRRRYFAVVAADVGLRTVYHPYDRISRSGAKASRNILGAIRLGLSVLVHNSVTPLRLASGLGLVGSMLSFMYSFYVVAVFLFKSDVAPGWTTVSLTISVLFGLVFFMLALIGEYLGRLLDESTDRPLYHVRDERSSSVMLANIELRNVMDRS